MVVEVKIAVKSGATTKGLGSAAELVCMYVAHMYT